jgi:hypothetical protein
MRLKNLMLSDDFPWYYTSFKVGRNFTHLDDARYDFQFIHNFYNRFHARSPYLEILDPLINSINPSAIVRIKANITTVTEKPVIFAHHVDFEEFDGETAIFYVNSNDGQTIFQSGEKIDSVENRLVTFPANLMHTGTTCTDQKVRCVINLNYYKWNKNDSL